MGGKVDFKNEGFLSENPEIFALDQDYKSEVKVLKL